jgi:hypothetical protein
MKVLMIPPSYPDPFPYSWSPGMKKHEGLSLPIPLRQGKYMGKEKKVTNAQDKKGSGQNRVKCVEGRDVVIIIL